MISFSFTARSLRPYLAFIATTILAAAAPVAALGQNAQADLWQARNGTPQVPRDPVEWVRGNAGPANSHYLEGFSVPYRLVLSGLTAGVHRVVIEWDTRQKGKHAFDYLTHYQRMLPHEFGAHQQAEAIQPLDGLDGPFAAPNTFSLPLPSPPDSPVADQPGRSFLDLPPAERAFTIWNGNITALTYLSQGSLSLETASSQLAIDFVAEQATVVIAWGAHLATKGDWGVGMSATQIGGAPYHMRKISLDGSGGNQDRSLQAVAVLSPPTCEITGPTTICAGVTNTFHAITDTATAVFSWTLHSGGTGAVLIGPTDGASVQVLGARAGTIQLQATAAVGTAKTADSHDVTVNTQVAVEPISDQSVCFNTTVTLTARATGTGPLVYSWRKDGLILPDANTEILVLESVQTNDAGLYCVEVTGVCGSRTQCASLTVDPAPILTCPNEIVRACISDLPPPDPASVLVQSGAVFPVTVIFVGDVTNAQDGDFIVTRTYQTVGGCGPPVSCVQRLIGRDRTPPQFSCAASRVVSEDPPDSGQAVVTYEVSPVTDTCDPAPVLECRPPSGASFPVGDTRVECVALDVSGNRTVCGFDVRVVPRRITVNSLNDSGPGTLRQAMLDANAAPGSNTVVFAFPGQGPYTISLLSALPPVTETLFIDGWSQLTFSGTPVVELDGHNAATPFAPAAGDPQPAPAVNGLVLASPGNVVRGLVLHGFTVGLRIEGPGGNLVTGNYIGADPTGNNSLGNTLDGILLTQGTSSNRIGPDNLIAFNGRNGVTLDSSAGSGNTILGNRIVFNGNLPIDLGGDGATPNDPEDPDAGPNGLQNSPVIVRVHSDGFTSLTIEGTIEGQPLASITLDFYLERPDVGPDPQQAQIPLGAITLITDQTGHGSFVVSFPFGARSTQFVTATATDAEGSTSEQAARAPVRTPPIILEQPVGATVALGETAALCVVASGTEPLFYQWRRNGANIPGATNACFFISEVTKADGGSLTVVLANELDAVTSEPALLLLNLPDVAAGDNFVDRIPLFGPIGVVTSTNSAASRESDEPNHAGKLGGHSVWYAWTAPADGIVTVATTGSTFDTLLGVYLGNSLTILEAIATDEDRGGYFTSQARFNVVRNLEYQIAIDGFGGASGHFVLSWDLIATAQLLPLITNQPVSQTVFPGGLATFHVGARSQCTDPHHACRNIDREEHPEHPQFRSNLRYQWFLNGQLLLGATNATLIVTNASEADLGNYTAQVREGSTLVESLPASLQLNLTGAGSVPAQASDKFLDAVTTRQPLILGGATGEGGGGPFKPASLVRGYTGTQVFNTSGSLTEGEVICGVIGGSSEWISLVAEETGMLFLNTDGSSFDTVMAVFRRSPTNAIRLEMLTCDNDSGTDHRDSALQVPVQAGQTNFIIIDGVNGALGTLYLNYKLVPPAAQTFLSLFSQRPGTIRVSGNPNMRLTLQGSSNLVNWTTILTTNAPAGILELSDPTSLQWPNRYYRALLLP